MIVHVASRDRSSGARIALRYERLKELRRTKRSAIISAAPPRDLVSYDLGESDSACESLPRSEMPQHGEGQGERHGQRKRKEEGCAP